MRWVALAAAFAFTAWVLNGVDITGGFWAYVWVALIFGIVNADHRDDPSDPHAAVQPDHARHHLAPDHRRPASITDALTSHLTIDDFFWTTIWAAIILAIAAVVVELILQLIFWREPVVAA